MSNAHDPASMDPRYDGIYQRGGSAGTGRRDDSGAAWAAEREPSGADRPQSARSSSSSSSSPLPPQEAAPRSTEPRAAARSTPARSASAPDTSRSEHARSPHSPENPFPRMQAESSPPRADEQQVIREVGPPAPEDTAGSGDRNPYDPWIWGTAAALLALGIFFLMAPVLYAETTPVLQSGPYYSPWFNYTMSAGAPLILVGVATAVTQLFVLSIRHARRHR